MKRMELLDYGRFVAAICVLAFHYLFNGIQNGKISSVTYVPSIVYYVKYGFLGVEFFFMISGYVIFISAKSRTASEFAVSRAVRIYPAFWVAVVLTSVVAQFWGGTQMPVSFFQAIANLTMLPGLFGYGFVDGVYWTLQFELKFYFLVFFCLMAGLQSKLELVFLLWPIVMLFALFAGYQHLPFMGGYYYFFSAGAVFAIQKNKFSACSIVSLVISFYLCIIFIASKAIELSESKNILFSMFVTCVILIIFYVFFFVLNSKIGLTIRIPGSRLAGDLTYPLYLIHAHIGYMIISKYATQNNMLIVYSILVCIIMLLSYLIHKYVEKKYFNIWNYIFSRTLGKVIDNLHNKHICSLLNR